MTAHKLIMAELARARELHPEGWPGTTDRMTMRTAEEALEVAESAIKAALRLVRAANDLADHGGSIEDVRTELIQTAAMCYRMLEAMEVKPISMSFVCTEYPGTSLKPPCRAPYCVHAPSIRKPPECVFSEVIRPKSEPYTHGW